MLFVIVQMWPFTLTGRALMPDTWRSIHPWARGADVNENQASIYDTVLEYGPWFEYSQSCLKEGRVPHWNPWQFCGAPLYANRLIPYFFPPFIAAELVANPHKIIGWFQLFNLILSGWGMYLLLRRWRMARAVATVGALVWLTCGVHFLPFPLWTLGAAGFPWLLWALEGFLEKPDVRLVAVAGFIAGLILMVGYPVMVVHLSYFTAIYFFCRWWTTRRLGPIRIHWIIPILVIVATFILGFGLSSIANVPAWRYSRETVRHVEGFTDKAFEREKRMLLTPPEEAGMDPVLARFGERMDVLLPINGRGTFRAWMYGGIVVYLLAFLGILAGRPQARLVGILGFVFAVMVWVPEVYIFLLDILPGWKVTIFLPIEVVNLSACILAACGIEALTGGRWAPDRYGKALFCVLAVAAIVLTARFLYDAPIIDLPILIRIPEPNLLAYSPFHIFFLAATVVVAVTCVSSLAAGPKVSWLGWTAAVMTVLFSLLTFFYLQPVYSRADYMPSTPFTDWLEDATKTEDAAEGNRLARWAILPLPFNPHSRAKSPFTPNLQMLCGVQDVGGYDSLVPRRLIEYGTLFEDQFMDYRALIAYQAPSTMYHQRFRAMGVRWILSLGELPDESRQGCTLVWDDRYQGSREGTDELDDYIQVWEVIDPQPRAFLTRMVAFSSDPNDSPLVQAANLAAQRISAVVVEDPKRENRTFAFPEELESDGGLILERGEVRFVRDDPENLAIEVHAPEDCYLVLRDGWFPEWEASIDGERTEIYPADAAFRAVEIPAGDHVVEFRYVARSFRTGMWITIGTLLLLAALYVAPGGKTRYMSPTASNL